jgi:EAL domain-containing protein (putative c-di-GMP-specific phosphodiesterase class I)
VVAEGVENHSQYQVLVELGCNWLQGYYFSPPLPPEAFEALLRADAEH